MELIETQWSESHTPWWELEGTHVILEWFADDSEFTQQSARDYLKSLGHTIRKPYES